MKDMKINIPESVVNDIQIKDFAVVSMQSVVSNLLETHALDTDTRLIESPVFLGYQKKLIEARTEFERAKDAMLVAHVDEKIRAKVTNWNLDYNSCTLTLQVRD